VDRVVDRDACILGCDEFEYHVCQTLLACWTGSAQRSLRRTLCLKSRVCLCAMYNTSYDVNEYS